MKEILEDYTLSKDTTKKKGLIKEIGVVGAGSTGQDIIIVVARAGFDVVMLDVSQERINEIMITIGLKLDKMINRWGMTNSDKKAILSRIVTTVDFSSLKNCDIVIESVNSKKSVSNLEIRKDVFKKIEENVPIKTIIVSNASTVLISDLSNILKYQERAIGVHFISPITTVPLVEVNKCVITNSYTVKTIDKFAKMLNKDIINVTASPGNISTRLIIPLINEACELLMEGVGTVSDIDKTLMKGYGMQSGPFTLADKIGLDKLVKWMNGLYNEFGDIKYKPSPLIKRLVRTKLYGKHVGEGFYLYSGGKRICKSGSIINLGRNK
ncbi:MAG: 3-hydroxyacyl-CoA dehydrogenase family protein [Bacteroidota bacterium]|nr:3-hydroxyacyl-CoA dehydrogenase family protein [Bacteroidota bacterium]